MKKAIVIGASSGIGKEFAKLLVQQNYLVGITGRRIELLNELKNEKPEYYIAKSFDIAVTNNISEQLTKLTLELNGLDLLLISAGTGFDNDDLDFEIEKNTIETNVFGFTAVADFAFNYFQKQKHGHLAAITSIAGLRGNRSAPAYNATKAYQINYLEGLRQKAYQIKMPITVTDIRPGFVNTAMAKSEIKFWVASPHKAAKQILDAVKAKKKIVYITKRWRWLALLLKVIPPIIYNRM